MRFKLEVDCETIEFENALTKLLEKVGGEGETKYNETRGVKPGTARGKYKKHENSNGSENGEDSNSGTNESAADASKTEEVEAPTPPKIAPKSEKPSPPPKIETKAKAAPKAELAEVEEVKAYPALQEVLDALKQVNLEVNTDVARECLAEFKAARCSAIPEEERAAFIDLCNSKLVY